MQRTAPALTLLPALLPAALLLGSALPGQAITTYSHDPNAPTVLSGTTIPIVGTVSNTGTVVNFVSPTSQYVTFTVPKGLAFTRLTLESYNSTDGRGFIGLMRGNTWTTAPSGGALPNALAYNHFGVQGVCALQYLSITPSGVQNCVTNPASQSNLLTKTMGAPLTERLLEGDYTLWIQQTRSTPVTFAFTAKFSPVPGPVPFLGVGAGLAFSRRLRQRRSLADQGVGPA